MHTLNRQRPQFPFVSRVFLCRHKQYSQQYCNVTGNIDGTLMHDGIVTKKDPDCEYLLHLKAKTNAELKTYIQTSPNRYNI